MNKKTICLMVLSAILVTSPAYAETIKRTLEVDGTPDVHIINAIGDIIVEGGASERIEIDAKLSDSAERMDVKERGDRVTIEVIYKGKRWTSRSSTKLYVRVPQGSNLKVEAISADVMVEAVRGELSLASVSGDVTADSYGGRVDASTTSGDVRLIGDGSMGGTTIGSTSGDVTATGLAGWLKANSVSGDVIVRDSELERVSLGAVSGDLTLNDSLVPLADIEAEAVSGDVGIMLAKGFAGRVDVDTLNGDINNCFGPKAQRTSRYGPGRTLNFEQGDGDGRVEIDTVSGDVKLCID
ncbi:MAG: DUF4097 family beta strand repeat-containing protein [Pseudomonadota bacterium]